MSEKEHSVDFLMIKLLHVYATKIFHQLSHVNLHPGQMPMLDILYRQEGLSQREICSRLCIKPSTVTVSLQRMEKAALIYRVADAKDKRIPENLPDGFRKRNSPGSGKDPKRSG